MSPTATTFLITGYELSTDGFTFIATITLTTPDHAASVSTKVSRFQANQLPKALTGQISLSRLYLCDTTAVRDCPTLQISCVQQDLTAAVTTATPDGITAAFLRGSPHDGQVPYTITNCDFGNFCFDAHGFIPSRRPTGFRTGSRVSDSRLSLFCDTKI